MEQKLKAGVSSSTHADNSKQMPLVGKGVKDAKNGSEKGNLVLKTMINKGKQIRAKAHKKSSPTNTYSS